MMAGIRRKNTTPEILVRRALYSEGLYFRLHRKDLPGSPDIVLPQKKIVIFVNGCFWHQHSGCKYSKIPSSNTNFWNVKLKKNLVRDQEAINDLLSKGWRVLTIWECATRIKNLVDGMGLSLVQWIMGDQRIGEIPARQGKGN